MTSFTHLNALIGQTPMAAISFFYKGQQATVYIKLEHYNLTGSIKDRIALHMIRRAYERGEITPGNIICEGTSGNTGIALSAVGSHLGHKVVIFMPDWMTSERISLIKSFGAEVRLLSQQDGGFSAIPRFCADFAKGGNVFLTQQFDNPDNIEAHFLTTGAEIIQNLKTFGKTADAFVAGVGTGGTLVGVSKALRQNNPGVLVYPLEPDNSTAMSGTGKDEPHFIYGIGDGFVPGIMDGFSYKEVITVNQTDAVIMAQKLSTRLGLGVGISSGANFLGAVQVLEKIGFDKTVVSVFSDDNKKYLSSAYGDVHPEQPGYISKDVELIGFDAVK
ncbi:MAG: cysteine synthase family protein [Lactobacillales bacterium]|nr:cysteine synthase family protein [Lactobacillales bacterium]